ncbi:MAG TPA: methyltransferase [Allocoleopsis sp.]
MLLSSRPLKDIFFCPEESNFYSNCIENLVLKHCVGSESIIEFGSGDGSPVIQALLRTEFEGTVHGFEINHLACDVAHEKISEYELSDRYKVHCNSFFDSLKFQADYLISNPPYLPALDNKIYQPFLHGGIDGITVTKKLLSCNHKNVLVMAASYSDPQGLVDYAHEQDYVVSDFIISPLPFGYYSSDPKVQSRIADLRREKRAFYTDNLYLLAGVLFTKQEVADNEDVSIELMRLMTAL